MLRGYVYDGLGIVLTLLVCFLIYVAVEFLAQGDYFSGVLLIVSSGFVLKGAVEFGKLGCASRMEL